jgi:comEA protein
MKKFFFSAIFLSIILLGLCRPVAAQQDSSAVEWIKVYFDMPSDHSVAMLGDTNRAGQDLIGTLVSLIDSSTSSVDLCVYDLENPRIGHALVHAKKRGVQVRVITDDDNRRNSPKLDSLMWSMLESAGIISMDDDGDVYMPDGTIFNHSLVGSSYFMHDKFAVIDFGDGNPDNDYVWTGSTNLTYTAEYNTNNVVVIKDNEVARTYTNEFNQMWGGTSKVPNPDEALFHKDKNPHEQHTFFVGDTKVQIYFAPENRDDTKPDISKRLVRLIKNHAQSDVDFLSFAMSPSYPVSREIWRMSAKGKIKLNGVIDHLFYARYKNKHAIWASFGAETGGRMILGSNEMRKLHDKILILNADERDSSADGIVVTGSYNFSKSADRDNDENLLIIYSDKITNQYYQAFMGVMNRAKGKTQPPAPPVSTKRWYKVNPGMEDGSEFTINVVPGFAYGVYLLGVKVPGIYAGKDSSDYYAGRALKYMKDLLDGASVKIEGPYGSKPKAGNGAFQAYVTVRKNGKIFSVNKRTLQDGIGQYFSFYPQHPDSVKRFKQYQAQARRMQKGMWQYPDSIGTKIVRLKALGNTAASQAKELPVNINTADAKRLQLLPGIGPTYAKRIIAYRKKHGSFKSVDELENVKGIGPSTLQKLRPDVVVH